MTILLWIAGALFLLFVLACILNYQATTVTLTDATPDSIAKQVKSMLIAGKSSFTIKHDYSNVAYPYAIDNILNAIVEECPSAPINIDFDTNKVLINVIE